MPVISDSDSEIVQKFVKRVKSEDISQIVVNFKTNGGVPGEHLSEDIMLSGNGEVRLNRTDDVNPEYNIQGGTLQLTPTQTKSLLLDIGAGFESFHGSDDLLPDSLIGMATIQFDNNKAFRYFLATEQDRKLQDKPLSPQMEKAVLQFYELARQIGGNTIG